MGRSAPDINDTIVPEVAGLEGAPASVLLPRHREEDRTCWNSIVGALDLPKQFPAFNKDEFEAGIAMRWKVVKETRSGAENGGSHVSDLPLENGGSEKINS